MNNCLGVCPNSRIWASKDARSFGSSILFETGKQTQNDTARMLCKARLPCGMFGRFYSLHSLVHTLSFNATKFHTTINKDAACVYHFLESTQRLQEEAVTVQRFVRCICGSFKHQGLQYSFSCKTTINDYSKLDSAFA